MRYIYIGIICFMSCWLHVDAQSKENVYDLARYGTVAQMDSLYKVAPAKLDSVDSRGFTPLILACYRGNNEVAKFISEHTKQINYASDSGTALTAVVFKNNIGLTEFLLEQAANPNIPDVNGMTPLIYAIQFKNERMVELLLQNGADATQKDSRGKSPFEYAVFSKNEKIINLLKK